MDRLTHLVCMAVLSLWGGSSLCASKISVTILERTDQAEPVIYLPGGTPLPVSLDASGKGSVEIDNERAMYVKLGYNHSTRLLWLAPEAEVEIRFTDKESVRQATVEGTDRAVNEFLNRRDVYAYAMINDTGLDEEAFFAKSDSLAKANVERLQNTSLPEAFKREELQRLTYYSYQTLPVYPRFHSRITKDTTYVASPAYWEKLQGLATFDASRMVSDDYLSFLQSAVARLAGKEFPQLKGMQQLTAYLDKNVKDARLADYLVYQRAMVYVGTYGLTGADDYVQAVGRYVKDARHLKAFERLCDRWKQVNGGKLSPDFNATDVAGVKHSLKEFRGKYVYIDIWATWCAPCKKEIPHLIRLEEQYAGKDIVFVSISCDENRKAWENKVTKDQMKGVQLHFEKGDTFMQSYMISGIPRFILLDKEGRILSADMTRPSDPATAVKLNELIK